MGVSIERRRAEAERIYTRRKTRGVLIWGMFRDFSAQAWVPG